MTSFSKKTILNISIIFIILQAAFAEELVIPVIKAPYSIENAQWDNSGNYFAYQVKDRIYIRDALTLLLKDSFAADPKSQLSAFYKSPDLVDYPKSSIQIKGRNLTIRTKRNQNTAESTFSITNLPVEVKAAAMNPSQSHLAFIGSNGKAYIYDIKGKSVISSINCNSQSENIYFTSDNKIIFSDTNKTAGLYSIKGQKIKSYTNAKNIKGIALSPDQETLVLFEDGGNLNFFNVNNSSQLGYIPNLGSKEIQSIELSQDSRRFLITGKDKSLYVANLADFLFSPNTKSPATKQFAFNYNKLDPNSKNDDGVTEFGLKEITNIEDQEDAEFIESTKEKALEKQNFELADEKKAAQPVQITSQKEVKTYPSSSVPADREVTFTEEGQNVQELTAKVTEYKQSNQKNTDQAAQPAEKTTIAVTNEDLSKNSKQNSASKDQAENYNINNDKRTNQTNKKASSDKEKELLEEKNTSSTDKDLSKKSTEKEESKESDNSKDKDKEDKAKDNSKDKDKEDKAKGNSKDKDKDDSKDKTKDKDKKVINENIKTYFKDGHGLLINAGINRLRVPYLFNIAIPIGYRNYDLIQPFYFGGTTEISLGIPSSVFPYYYYDARGSLQTPKLLSIKVFSPIGFCIYPFKNSLELYVETGLGASFHTIWNTQFGSNWVSSKFYPSFYGNVKLGIAWDFLNLSICGSYDAILGFSYGLEVGFIININASRTIGSLVDKKK